VKFRVAVCGLLALLVTCFISVAWAHGKQARVSPYGTDVELISTIDETSVTIPAGYPILFHRNTDGSITVRFLSRKPLP
jgi:hypothetical protein